MPSKEACRPSPHALLESKPPHLPTAAALERKLVVRQLLLQVRRQAAALQPHHKADLQLGIIHGEAWLRQMHV